MTPNVCTGCFNKHWLNPGDWEWCPEHKNTPRHFECTKTIKPEQVIVSIDKILAITATSASNITTAVTGGGTHYLTFVDQAGTRPPKVASLLEYNAATNNLTVTASFATTASFASNSSVTQVNAQSYDNGTSVVSGDFKFIAGKTTMTVGAATSSAFPVLVGKILGTHAWITANYLSA
jgi:hypothetical protein